MSKMSFVSDFLPFFDELKLIDGLSAPLFLKKYHTLPPYVIMQSLRHVIYIYHSQFYHRLSGNDKKVVNFQRLFSRRKWLKTEYFGQKSSYLHFLHTFICRKPQIRISIRSPDICI
jgi:hypothetical protein